MGNAQSGACCGSYKVKQPEANMSRTQKKKFQTISYSHAKSTQITQSNLSSLNQKVPNELETKNSLTTVSSNNLSTPNHSPIRNSIGENIKILVKVKQVPLSQIEATNTDSNVTKRGEEQSNFALKSKQSKSDGSPNKIFISKEDFARELRNTDISGLYLPEVTVGPTSKFYESNINP